MRTIEYCRACGGKRVKQFFNLGDQPFANALLEPEKINDEKQYPLSLSYCEDCSLVQLDYTADPKELFSNYFWVTGTSVTAREYANIFCERALTEKQISTSGYVLEIASNDGTFLRPFVDRGYSVLGVDPAENIVKKANEEGITTKEAFFGSTIAREIIEKKGYPDIVFARNVMPHVADVRDFVKGLSICCGNDSLLIVEVHYAGTILDELHYDSIYHEHLCYFSLKSVTELLKAYGLHAYDVMRSPISGGSVVLYCTKAQRTMTQELLQLERDEQDNYIDSFDGWDKFADRAAEHSRRLYDLVKKEVDDGHKVYGYGASARSSTLLNYCGIDNKLLEVIMDRNPLKHGKLTPGTHIMICDPDEVMKNRPDTILLLAWNFKDEIIDILKKEYCFSGRVIIPLPYEIHTIDI